jgi:hypothetical protein
VRAALLAAAVVLAAAGSAAGASSLSEFRTPSRNIGCIYAPKDSTSPTYLRCDIRTGLRPKPARPAKCDLDWGDSYTLLVRGLAKITCHGDTTLDPRYRVLHYGSTWKRGGFSCTSRRTGLRCRGPAGHGFFLSKQHSYRF